MKLLNRQEAAEVLKCSVSKIRRLEEEGYLIPIKLPQTGEKPATSKKAVVAYDLEDIKTLIQKSKDWSRANKSIFEDKEPKEDNQKATEAKQ